MSGKSVDAIREGVIRRMEQQAQTIRFIMLGAAGVEAIMLGLALYLVDWQQRTHVLLFVFSVLGYTIIVLGLVALGAHVSRTANRIVAALETLTVRA